MGPDGLPLKSNGYVSHHSVSEMTILNFADRPPHKDRMVRRSTKFYTERSSNDPDRSYKDGLSVVHIGTPSKTKNDSVRPQTR